MSGSLPDELISSIHQQILLRQTQLQQLSLYYHAQRPLPSCLVAFGPEGSNKSETIRHVLDREAIDHITINCRECLSQRHLLTKIFAKFVTHLGRESFLDKCDRLDSINALASNLRKLLTGREAPLILVLLNADHQRGATATLLPALARLRELIPCLALILTSSSPHPLTLHRTGVPYIHFPPFERNEAIQILLQYPPLLLPNPLPHYAKDVKQEKVRKIYNQFATVLYDTLIGPTTNSLQKYREVCEELWPRFIWPLVSCEKPPGKSTTLEWDFARLLGRSRVLFQSAGEEALQEQLVSTQTQPRVFQELIEHKDRQDSVANGQPMITDQNMSTTQEKHETPLLKFLPTLLLLSAYLASHTHPKHDIVLFSRLSNASSTNRRKKKYLARSRAGGITKTPTKSPAKKSSAPLTEDGDVATPTKKSTASKAVGMENATPKKERADRSMRAIFEKTSNVAHPFTLERVIAILRAIHPDGLKSGKGIADRIYSELGELERLRLVVRNDPKAAGKGNAEEILEQRWKCVVGRDWVVEAGKSWSVSIEGFEVE